jgi:predicted dehydrogenase
MIRIGVICPSEIASRRFLPALKQSGLFKFAGVAVADRTEFEGASDEVLSKEIEKAKAIQTEYGGEIFDGYHTLIESGVVDAVYLPLPPALHFHWAYRVLQEGKHALVEKPCTTSLKNTESLVALAKEKQLALHENYMFTFHRQMEQVREIVDSGQLGEVRLYRIDFGFPMRAKTDFRYNKALGGGALLDCAGYTLRCASFFLGQKAQVVSAAKQSVKGFEVDMFGSATMRNEEGLTAQLAWGMDNNYRCSLDIWGSKGTLHTDRIMTAPVGFVPHATLKLGNDEPITLTLDADDAFKKSIEHFYCCIQSDQKRVANYEQMCRQAELIDQFNKLADDE